MAKTRLVSVPPLPDLEGGADIATLVGFEPGRGLEVELHDGRRLYADTTLELTKGVISQAVAQRRKVLVVETRSSMHVVTGMLQTAVRVEAPRPDDVSVHIDGDRLVLQGRQEIELRCGEASIVLRRDGEVVIRGTRIASRSRGANVMTGATIRLN